MKKGCEPKGKWQKPWNKAGLAGRMIFWGQVSIGLLVCGNFFCISPSRLRQSSPEVFWESLQKVKFQLKIRTHALPSFSFSFLSADENKNVTRGPLTGFSFSKTPDNVLMSVCDGVHYITQNSLELDTAQVGLKSVSSSVIRLPTCWDYRYVCGRMAGLHINSLKTQQKLSEPSFS